MYLLVEWGPFQTEGFQNSEFEPNLRVTRVNLVLVLSSEHGFRVGLMNSESDLCLCMEI